MPTDENDESTTEDESLDHEVDPDLRAVHEINEWRVANGENPL